MTFGHTTPNHLIHEKSPYLLQHAYNPVDWRPWGKPAIEKAKTEDKPILLSIGYSTCHWCHVMERESFTDPDTAELMNAHFVNIKVDREERPDLDKIYITAVSALSGSAGWPLNVFLTPDLKPFFGGTYFPPRARYGSPSWPDLLNLIATAWKNPVNRQKLLSSAEELTETLRVHLARGETGGAAGASLDPGLLTRAFETLAQSYDRARGGFGKAPKFPTPSNQNFLLFYHEFIKNDQDGAGKAKDALGMVAHTLKAMAEGGIYDHIGGGFARYSTDAKWHVPHFEKMLYDNAQLIVNYLEAFQITRDPAFAATVAETIEYILRDMTHPEGGFYSAEDADSVPPGLNADLKPELGKSDPKKPSEPAGSPEKSEGAFYLWSKAEILERLGDETAEIFSYRYGIRAEGNAEYDPHQEFTGKNILYAARSLDETAERFHKSKKDIHRILDGAKNRLLEIRNARPRPHRDDKVLTSWNGLMISALARSHQVLNEPKYYRAAVNAAGFIRKNLYDPETPTLFRRWREGERKIPGMASDYAFFTQGLIDLYETDFDPKWLDWAIDLADEQIRLFHDRENGGFFMTRSDPDSDLILRVKEDLDDALPSAGSVACLNLIRLSALSDRQGFFDAAEKTLLAAQSRIAKIPSAAPQMLVALGMGVKKPIQVIIAGDPDEAGAKQLIQSVRSVFIPGRTIMVVNGAKNRERLARRLPFISFVRKVNDAATAYVCINRTCTQPITDPDALVKLLETGVSGMQDL